MFRNYLKTAIRNLQRYKTYSFINIAGLAIGIACTILILLWVQDELSYDRFHTNADRIYRLVNEMEIAGKTTNTAITPAPMGPALVREYPEVIQAVRFAPISMQTGKEKLMRYKDNQFYEKRIYWVDSNVFDVFTLPLIKGIPKTALANPYSIILTEEMANKYFGDDDPLGKIITYDNDIDFKITGILKNVPKNTHLHFDFLLSFATLKKITEEKHLKEWINFAYLTYLLLPENYLATELEKKFPEFCEKYFGEAQRTHGMKITLYLQPLTRIHLHSHLEYEAEVNDDISTAYIFSVVALFVLLIACMNYINLATAHSAHRIKEVGIRKVVGANRPNLIRQFMGESILLAFIALTFAIIVVELSLPVFNPLTGKSLEIDFNIFLVYLMGITIFTGIAAGSFPALFLSSFQPVKVLKGTIGKANLNAMTVMRKILVVVQFVISITLIIGTWVVYNQLDYMRNKKLGLSKEHVVVIPIKEWSLGQKYELIKNEFSQIPGVLSVSASSHVPGDQLIFKQLFKPEGLQENENMVMQTIMVDYDFIKTFGIELLAGRNFSKEFVTDKDGAFILNETAVEKLGWESPIGKHFEQPVASMKKGKVIGVVKNFHVTSLHTQVEPLVLHIWPREFSNISVRVCPNNIKATISSLKREYQKLDPAHPFEYFFLDEQFNKLYKAEEKLGRIFGYFTFLAIFIACLGLFGLASFTAERRNKEIGIHKVLGASVSGIVFMLSKDFTKWILLANIIAWPIAYYAMNKWLQNFAYRINIGWWVFVMAGGIALVTALLTISWQAIRAATANPVEALRYE